MSRVKLRYLYVYKISLKNFFVTQSAHNNRSKTLFENISKVFDLLRSAFLCRSNILRRTVLLEIELMFSERQVGIISNLIIKLNDIFLFFNCPVLNCAKIIAVMMTT